MQEEIFEKYPIPKAYFKLALPVVFSMVISLVYNMVDTYFIEEPAIRIWWRELPLDRRSLR